MQRLIGILGLAGMAPGPDTSRPHPQHKIYPYLLRGVNVIRPNQVWSTYITYIRLARGFVYLVAVIDWYSRKVLSWRLSNTPDSGFCVDCLEQALQAYGTPEIFNTDQGCQFTSKAFTGVLLKKGIAISMDGRGRALDNIFVERLWSGSRARLPAPSPLRTVHATFTAHGSSLYKGIFRHPVFHNLCEYLHNTHLQPSCAMMFVTPESAHTHVAASICFPSV